MAAQQKKTRPEPFALLGRVALLVVCLALAATAAVIGSSLISHGHGMLGLSETESLLILTPLTIAAAVGGLGLLWRAMSGQLEVPGTKAVPAGTRQKRQVASEEWFALLGDAEREFYIAGHSLGLWCSASNRSRFTDQVRRILAKEGKVTLVMLGPGSPQLTPLHVATGTDYRGRIERSRQVLGELEDSLEPAYRSRLRVTMLEDHVPLPYMVVGNEKRLLTATYLARTDSEAMPCLELERGSETGRAIYDDFHKLAEEG